MYSALLFYPLASRAFDGTEIVSRAEVRLACRELYRPGELAVDCGQAVPEVARRMTVTSADAPVLHPHSHHVSSSSAEVTWFDGADGSRGRQLTGWMPCAS